ncbi:MAG: twin-arginine translocase subunit TatC [Myxococcales bacterium]|nr:twin-arginine translocase subunit TatC [Myxococcales bacterium]
MSSADEVADVPEDDVKMTIWEHVAEFRKRLIRAAAAVVVGAGVVWTFRERVLGIIAEPYRAAWKERFPNTPVELQTLAPADAFLNYLQLALVGGVILAMPVVFYQLWAFVSPGLYSREKRLVIPFVVFSSSLFGGGVYFAYKVAFPFSFQYFFSLLGELGDGAGGHGVVVTSRPTLEYYLDFATRMLLAFGFVFELPLFIGFLALAGIVTPRQLLRFGKWAVILSFAIGAFITPPDVMSQAAVAGALIALYFLSVGIAFIIAKRRDDEPPAEEET